MFFGEQGLPRLESLFFRAGLQVSRTAIPKDFSGWIPFVLERKLQRAIGILEVQITPRDLGHKSVFSASDFLCFKYFFGLHKILQSVRPLASLAVDNPDNK